MRVSMILSAAAAASLLAPRGASAFDYLTCGGDPIVAEGNTLQLTQNTYSISCPGSRCGAMNNGVDRWNGVQGMVNVFSWSVFGNPSSTIDLDDGVNDVAVVSAGSIDNNAGLTVRVISGCEIVEANVMVSSDLGFGQPEPIITTGNEGKWGHGRFTFLHELGHGLGLQHYTALNFMRQGGEGSFHRFVRIGGDDERVDPMPDDAAGGRFLYPTGSSETNILATSQKMAGGHATNNHGHTSETTIISCTSGGGQFSTDFTGANNGTTYVTHNERWRLSTSSSAWSGGGTTLGTWYGGTYGPNGVYTSNKTFTIPALPVGIYYLYHEVDFSNGTSETRESDNVARQALRIQVIAC